MGLVAWIEKAIKKLTVFEIALFKLALITAGVVIGLFMPDMVKQYVFHFLGLFVLLYGYLIYSLVTKG